MIFLYIPWFIYSMTFHVFPYVPWFINQHGDENGHHQTCQHDGLAVVDQDSCGEALPAADGGDLAESNGKSKTLKWRLCKGHVIVHYLQILGYKYKSDIFIDT